MRQVPDIEIKKHLVIDNPWWISGAIDDRFRQLAHRAYFPEFKSLLSSLSAKRAVVLMGPRRVGKTVMIEQAIQSLLDDGVSATSILYVSIDHPVYTGKGLEDLLEMFSSKFDHQSGVRRYVFFDEIQYLPEWERHLKVLVDRYPDDRFVVSGSAAAALKMKSDESGAGRFTDFLLPPLTFPEFLRFRNRLESCVSPDGKQIRDIDALNAEMVDYINFGGFPESVIDTTVRDRMDRYVAHDIVDKVLLRDLPSLYGIRDTQELKRLFNVLAYNTGQEVNLDDLSKSAQIAKNTLKKYLEYLEAAFLIVRVYRVDETARRLKRVSHFKVYLTNPCLRAALFGPASADDDGFGFLAETVLVSQLAQSNNFDRCHYARWKTGEVDIVSIDQVSQRPFTAIEVKWNDRIAREPKETAKNLLAFAAKNENLNLCVCTRTFRGKMTIEGQEVICMPVAAVSFAYAKRYVDDVLNEGMHPYFGVSLSLMELLRDMVFPEDDDWSALE